MANNTTAWAAWTYDQKAAAHWAPAVTAALNATLTPHKADTLARDYAATGLGARNGRSDAELTDAALEWLDDKGLDTTTHLAPVLRDIHADGYLIGAASAAAAIDKTHVDLGGWKPGNTQAARKQAARLGVGDDMPDALDSADTRASGVAHTHRRRIARALALGTAIHQAPVAVGGAMLAVGVSSGHGVALTALVVGVGLAALAYFRRRKVATWQWITDPRSNVCPRCSENEDAGPIPVGQPFPSGDTSVPCHDHCACGIQAS